MPTGDAMADVELYSSNLCPYCWRAKDLLERKGVPYTEIDATDAEVRTAMIARAGGMRTVPQIFIGGRHIGGSDELAALDRAGQLDPLLAAG